MSPPSAMSLFLLVLLLVGGAPWIASSAEAANVLSKVIPILSLSRFDIRLSFFSFCALSFFPQPRHLSKTLLSLSPSLSPGAPIGNISLSPTLYPAVRRDEKLSETLHGLEIRDPYRWLEEPDSEETRKFVTEQNELSRSVLDAAPARAPFRAALDRGLNFPKFGSPSLRGGRYYYSYNPGLANQASLFSVPSLETPHSEATLLIDPTTLSKDGTVALFDASFSEDGRHVSYQLSSGGSDWRTVKVMRLDPETGKGTPLPGDDLKFVKFSSEVWSKDGLGFFYSRYPPPPAASNSSSNATTDLGTETDSAPVRRRGRKNRRRK